MKRIPRTLAGLAMACAAVLAAQAPARAADDFPSRPLHLVVPFAAGSGTDTVARLTAKLLSERLKQPVIVDNKAGANGAIGAEYVAHSAPDGYTLFMTTNTSHSAAPFLMKSLPYDPVKDFAPISRMGNLPFMLVISPKTPAHTLHEFIAYARAHPGL